MDTLWSFSDHSIHHPCVFWYSSNFYVVLKQPRLNPPDGRGRPLSTSSSTVSTSRSGLARSIFLAGKMGSTTRSSCLLQTLLVVASASASASTTSCLDFPLRWQHYRCEWNRLLCHPSSFHRLCVVQDVTQKKPPHCLVLVWCCCVSCTSERLPRFETRISSDEVGVRATLRFVFVEPWNPNFSFWSPGENKNSPSKSSLGK